MAHQVLTPPSEYLVGKPAAPAPEPNFLVKSDAFDKSLWQSIRQQIHERLHPQKLPPLQLTSRPVAVRDIWGEYNYKKKGVFGSTVVHCLAVGAIIGLTIAGRHVVQQVKPHETITYVPDVSQYMPLTSKKNDTLAGGGGGGDRDKIQAPKGRLPKFAMEQITPPAMVIRNDHPKLAVEPTVVVPPQVHIAQANMPTFGDPKAVIPSGPP